MARARVLLLTVAILAVLVAGEWYRCRHGHLPWVVPRSAVSGSSDAAVRTLGRPDRRSLLPRSELLSQGVGSFLVHEEDIASSSSSSFDVFFWERTCFFCLTREVLLVGDPTSGQVVYFEASSSDFPVPMILVGGRGVEETVAPSTPVPGR
jgi:hypothetical protein